MRIFLTSVKSNLKKDAKERSKIPNRKVKREINNPTHGGAGLFIIDLLELVPDDLEHLDDVIPKKTRLYLKDRRFYWQGGEYPAALRRGYSCRSTI